MIQDIELFTTSNEVKQQRLAVCESCDKFSIADETPTCTECNSQFSLLAEYNFKSCPLGKW